ncbi:uncharacterized protein A4U43_C06F15250 [Asparagus officinalis]|uniref:Serine-threonine/tyrosine-protein kinase catalytic domain-containing protein n=1 Tax=Asparagus officinalis TaxID=4686 RepID=A0A5P1ESM5_ASPOF|nr:uncharacterized protein A4U43_C06F15250 [Asparagus officinalis]
MLYEGVPGDRMVKLLQIALKCIYKYADARPTMSQVAEMIHSLKEEEDSNPHQVGLQRPIEGLPKSIKQRDIDGGGGGGRGRGPERGVGRTGGGCGQGSGEEEEEEEKKKKKRGERRQRRRRRRRRGEG